MMINLFLCIFSKLVGRFKVFCMDLDVGLILITQAITASFGKVSKFIG